LLSLLWSDDGRVIEVKWPKISEIEIFGFSVLPFKFVPENKHLLEAPAFEC